MLAAIVSGKGDTADIFFLVAVILAGLAAVITAARGALETALVPAAVAFGFLGLLVL